MARIMEQFYVTQHYLIYGYGPRDQTLPLPKHK